MSEPRPAGADCVAVLGGGGHAKVVIAALRACGQTVACVFDDRQELWGSAVLGAEVMGAIGKAHGLGIARALLAIGDNATRRRLAGELSHEWTTLIHPRAWVHPSVELGAGSVVMAGAMVQPESVIGRHAIINTGVSVDHDCRIGDFVHVAPGCHLAGNVTVGEGTLLGIGSCILPGRTVGAWTIVGAGSVVKEDLPDRVTALGVPARVREPRSR